ncbi:MAG: helix-turn-helix domain-containing protein [Polyangiaceae bacterium]|nr:helix-turn-helix domain-containing protein [Polyangiaceae bacterium]
MQGQIQGQRGRPKTELLLNKDETRVLEEWAQCSNTDQPLALRAQIIIYCASGAPNRTVAEKLRVSELTVGKWRRRFVASRLEGLKDKPRSGAPRRISDAQVRQVVALTLETPPEGTPQWSTRSMARAVGLSQSSVRRIWNAHNIQPYRATPPPKPVDGAPEEKTDANTAPAPAAAPVTTPTPE